MDPMTSLSRRAFVRTSARLVGLAAPLTAVSALGGCQVMSPRATLAPTTMRRIGYLYPGNRAFNQPYAAAFVD
jgi:hypothetical protein